MKKILLSGYYGFNNTGDEAILTAVCNQLKKEDVEISCLTNDITKTKLQNNINTYNRNSIKEIKKALKECDTFIMNGGSIFQDETSSRSIYYYLGLIMLAKKMKKPIHIYAHGVGPINKKINQYFFTKIIKKVDTISVRDKKSYNTLISLNIEKEKIKLTKDPAFMLEPVGKDRTNQILKDEKIELDKKRKKIGISIRNWKTNKNFVKQFAEVADKIIEEYNANIVFIPFHYPEDMEFSQKVIEQMNNKAQIIKNQYTPNEILAIMQKMDINIGVRLHSLIFSATLGIPFIGIDYDIKIQAFLKSLNYENKIKYDKIKWKDFEYAINKILNNYENITKDLRAKTKENKKIAKEDLKNLIWR